MIQSQRLASFMSFGPNYMGPLAGQRPPALCFEMAAATVMSPVQMQDLRWPRLSAGSLIKRKPAVFYSKDTKKRDLQREAKAHIRGQQWIDGGGLKDRAVTADALCEIHRRFLLPDLFCIEDRATKEKIKVIPGELRDRDLAVGNHVPVSPLAVPRSQTLRRGLPQARKDRDHPRGCGASPLRVDSPVPRRQ